MYQFNAKDLETERYPLCLGYVSKDFTLSNMKKTGLKGIIKVFFC